MEWEMEKSKQKQRWKSKQKQKLEDEEEDKEKLENKQKTEKKDRSNLKYVGFNFRDYLILHFVDFLIFFFLFWQSHLTLFFCITKLDLVGEENIEKEGWKKTTLVIAFIFFSVLALTNFAMLPFLLGRWTNIYK